MKSLHSEPLIYDYKKMARDAFAAWVNRDERALRALLHKDYHYKSPRVEIKGADKLIEALRKSPYVEKINIVEILVENNKAVIIGDWVVSAPFSARVPITTLMEFESGKIKNQTLFCNIKGVPELPSNKA